ncbi:MAG: type I-G CRISPR-associated helicase/endonuclease Cas3g [Thermoleophilaceae bacterium]
MNDRLERVFRQGTASEGRDGRSPYPWQRRFVLAPELPAATDAPTGSGKTETIVFGWLWRRRLAGDAELAARTPRRLAIALPMRVLVEQTARRIDDILVRLEQGEWLDRERPVRVRKLLGGEAADDWSLHPADDQILVGTIDMLLSRALNRGFGRGRGSWPLDFGLLNTDTLWVFDEVQLLDAALATSCQLAAFRGDPGLGAASSPGDSVWMSATMDLDWLRTVDHEAPPAERLISVDAADEEAGLRDRLEASKTVVRAELDPANAGAVAELVLERHATVRPAPGHPAWRTIVLCNTVARTRSLYDRLTRMTLEPEVVLLHSRFRPPDRAAALERALDSEPGPGGRIVVTTQVIEAGVDLDAAAMVTELAPWASIVQRAGRLNREGRHPATTLTWIDPPDAFLEKLPHPYEARDLDAARKALRELDGASAAPNALRAVATSDAKRSAALLSAPRRGLVLRRPDLVELFDTDPTLDGDDADVSQFIRLGDDLDVQIAWRVLDERQPCEADGAPHRDELCPVPIGERKRIAALGAWRWSYHGRRWEKLSAEARELVPGDVLIAGSAAGGYDSERGWDPAAREPVTPIEHPSTQPDSDAADPLTPTGAWRTIAEHTDDVVRVLVDALSELATTTAEREALVLAARFHDAGKAHPTFQERLGAVPDARTLWAKSADGSSQRLPVFRHEVASVLLLLAAHGEPANEKTALAAYLVGAHHGKLRLVPRLTDPTPGRARACLGVAEGVSIPDPDVAGTIDLGGGVSAPPLSDPDLRVFDLGSTVGWTWIESALGLRDELGPFRLGYLEALMVAADRLASSGGRDRASEVAGA